MAKSIKGTQTEKNLLTSSQENHKLECVTLILQVSLKKKVTNKLQLSLQKQPIRKRTCKTYV